MKRKKRLKDISPGTWDRLIILIVVLYFFFVILSHNI